MLAEALLRNAFKYSFKVPLFRQHRLLPLVFPDCINNTVENFHSPFSSSAITVAKTSNNMFKALERMQKKK